MHNGQLVEDEEVITLLAEAMDRKKEDTKGFFIDGFPATLAQAKLFEKRLGGPTKIIVLEVIQGNKLSSAKDWLKNSFFL